MAGKNKEDKFHVYWFEHLIAKLGWVRRKHLTTIMLERDAFEQELHQQHHEMNNAIENTIGKIDNSLDEIVKSIGQIADTLEERNKIKND